MILVLNASPLIFLVKIGLINKLPAMTNKLFIPDGVITEIRKHKDEAYEWVSQVGVKYSVVVPSVPPLISAWDLGLGESEVLAYAFGNKNMKVAIDDKAARNCARSLQIEVIGTIGLIVFAKKMRQIDDIEPYLKKLTDSGYRISQGVYKKALELGNS